MNKLKTAAGVLILSAIVMTAQSPAPAYPGNSPARGPLVLKTLDYVLDLKVDYEQEKLFGDCRLTVLNASRQPVDRVPLTLYRLLKVTGVAGADGAPLPFTQTITAYEDWDRVQINFIEVSLPTPVAAGAKAVIDIRYEGYLGGYQEAGVLYVRDKIDKDFTIIRMDGLAYPIVGVPSDAINRAAGLQAYDYRVSVNVPDTYQAANGGRFVGKATRAGRTTFTFRNIKPSWRMDVAVSHYQVLEDAANGLTVDHFPADAAGGAAVMKAMKDCIALFSAWFGTLPAGQGLTIIEVPEGYGSQADVTAILLTRDAFNDRGRLVDLYHEISHLWNVKELDPAPCRVESEGLAMLLQYVAQEKLEGKTGALDKGAERMRASVLKVFKEKPDYAGVAIADYGKKSMTDLSYTKGMLVFYLLYKMAGEKPLFDAVAACCNTYRASGATLDEFLATLEKSLGRNLSAFYKDWIYGAESSKLLAAGVTFDDILRRYK